MSVSPASEQREDWTPIDPETADQIDGADEANLDELTPRDRVIALCYVLNAHGLKRTSPSDIADLAGCSVRTVERVFLRHELLLISGVNQLNESES